MYHWKYHWMYHSMNFETDTVAAADLALPCIILGSWMYLTFTLSGFPYKSAQTKAKLSKVGRVALAWSLGRILYSVMILLTFTKV